MPSSPNQTQYGLGQSAVAPGGTEELRLPSGNVCLVKRLSPIDLLSVGILDKFDSLTALVQVEHVERVEAEKRGAPPKSRKRKDPVAEVAGKTAQELEELKALAANPQALRDIMELVDAVVVAAVVQPECHPAPANSANRLEGVIYVDMVDTEDKVAILEHSFKAVGSLKSFRR